MSQQTHQNSIWQWYHLLILARISQFVAQATERMIQIIQIQMKTFFANIQNKNDNFNPFSDSNFNNKKVEYTVFISVKI